MRLCPRCLAPKPTRVGARRLFMAKFFSNPLVRRGMVALVLAGLAALSAYSGAAGSVVREVCDSLGAGGAP